MNQSKLGLIIRRWPKARENARERATIGFGFASDWMKKWREIKQLLDEVEHDIMNYQNRGLLSAKAEGWGR